MDLFKSQQVIENIGAGDGGPATSTLGMCTSIENKNNGVQGDDFRSTGFSNFRNLVRRPVLNGVEMEWKNWELSHDCDERRF